MIESYENDFEYGVRQEAHRPYWKRKKWIVLTDEVVNLLAVEIWEAWLAMNRSGSVQERRQQAEELAHSARWRVTRRLDRYYRRKVQINAWNRNKSA